MDPESKDGGLRETGTTQTQKHGTGHVSMGPQSEGHSHEPGGAESPQLPVAGRTTPEPPEGIWWPCGHLDLRPLPPEPE